jgi:hypothetical protein
MIATSGFSFIVDIITHPLPQAVPTAYKIKKMRGESKFTAHFIIFVRD